MLRCFQLLILIVALSVSSMLTAEPVSRDQIKGLDEQVQDVKKDVLNLTSELAKLEEKLLFPSNTQVALFLSLKKDADFNLDSIQIKLDEKVIAHHLYAFRELEALYRGGVQKIYTGNIKTGDHDLSVSFIGKETSGGSYKRTASYKVNKSVGPKFVEIKITGPSVDDKGIQFQDW